MVLLLQFRELPILKPLNKYKLQDAVGLKDQKQRWLSYLVNILQKIKFTFCFFLLIILYNKQEMMRECLYEKNVNFNESYRRQKNVITSQIVRAVNI